MAHVLRNYSLSLVLAILFLAAWVLQTVMGWYDFKAEQQALGEAAAVFGSSGYIWHWGEATFENWQSEFLQLLSFVVLTTFLIHKGSAESKDGDERMQAALDRIERRLDARDALEQRPAAPVAAGPQARGNGVPTP
jgi:hypothetical protein